MPARQAQSSAVVQPPVDPLLDLQAILDLLDPITDLGDLTYEALDIRIWLEHTGMEIRNGTIDILPGAETANIKFLQKKTYDGIIYPEGVIDFTFRNILFRGRFATNTGLQQRNEALADAAGCGANAITTMTYEAGTVTFIDCRWEDIGNSAITGSFDHLIITNCEFFRVAKHCVGAREFAGCVVTIDGLTADQCGNFLDLHGEGGLLASASVATVDNIVVTNSTGRAKVSGNNWSIDAMNWDIGQDDVVGLNMYPGFDLARAPRRFHLTGLTTENIPTKGFRTGSNPGFVADNVIDDAYIENSVYGMQVLQTMTVTNSVFDANHTMFLGVPTEVGNSDVNVKTDLEWAQIYDDIEILMRAKRAEWGTSYPAGYPAYILPPEVLALMEEVP